MKNLIYTFLFFLASCQNTKQDEIKAKQFFDEKNYEKALNEINKIIKLEPDSINNYVLRAMIYNSLGKYEEDILDLDKIISFKKSQNKDSISLMAFHQRALAEAQIGQYKKALSDIDVFINNRNTIGSLSTAYINKASILGQSGNSENAQKYYELAIKENNKKDKSIDSQALVGLANLTKTLSKELIYLNEAISTDDKNPLAYANRSAVYFEIGKNNEAFSDSKKAILLDPSNSLVYSNLGKFYANYINNYDSALFYFQKAIELSSNSVENSKLIMNSAVINHRLGRYETALIAFKKAEETNPKDDVILYNMALLLSDMKNQDEALDKISKAIILKANNPEYLDLKGSILIDLNKFDEASEAFLSAIKLNQNYGRAYYNLGFLYGEQKNHKQSIKFYSNAVKLNYNLEETLVNLALEKIQDNQRGSACDDLKKAYRLGRKEIKSLISKYCE